MLKRPPRITVSWLMGSVAIIAVFLAFNRRKSIIETLSSPVTVADWTPSGLLIASGQIVMPKGMVSLPATSIALSEATKRGIEIAPDGRVFGLVRVHHWCGNDPVGEHIVRVDLAQMLEFIGEGQPASSPVPEATMEVRPGGRFSPRGWDVVECCIAFRTWCEIVDKARSKAATMNSSPQRTQATALR